MSDNKRESNIKSNDEKKEIIREYSYYVNDEGIYKDIGEDCKGYFFDNVEEAFEYWKSNNNNNNAEEA